MKSSNTTTVVVLFACILCFFITVQGDKPRNCCSCDMRTDVRMRGPNRIMTQYTKSFRACCKLCGTEDIGCKAVAFERSNGKCELYDGQGPLISWYGHDVGFLRRDDDDDDGDDDDGAFAVSK